MNYLFKYVTAKHVLCGGRNETYSAGVNCLGRIHRLRHTRSVSHRPKEMLLLKTKVPFIIQKKIPRIHARCSRAPNIEIFIFVPRPRSNHYRSLFFQYSLTAELHLVHSSQHTSPECQLNIAKSAFSIVN